MRTRARRHTCGHSYVQCKPLVILGLIGALLSASLAPAQDSLKTPLEPQLLELLTNEVSGQMAFNTLVRLAGAPWIRDPAEFTDTFWEADELYRLVRSYGIETVRLDRHPAEGTFMYPIEGELWIIEPEPRRVAVLGADTALVASGSQSGEATGQLVYIPALTAEQLEHLGTDGRFQGRVALMWSHPRGDVAETLDAFVPEEAYEEGLTAELADEPTLT